jgi:DNA-binding HxlR family transcriptional regulator
MVVTMLMGGRLRFNDLRRSIGGISQQMLTRTLRSLELDGLVLRTVHPTIPPQVEYDLTELGHSLSIPLTQLARWVMDNLPELERNRVDVEASEPPQSTTNTHRSAG